MASNLLTLARDLHRRRARRRRKLALVEGWRLVEDALDAGVIFRGVLVDTRAGERPADAAVLRRLADRAVPVEELTDIQLAGVCSTESPQGVLAIVEPRSWEIDDIKPAAKRPTLVIDAVQEPGNVGALLRTAHALGAAGVVLLPGTADPGNPRVIRGAMGASFRLPVVQLSESEFGRWVKQSAVKVLVAEPSGAPLRRREAQGPVAVVVGNEAAGIRPEVRALATDVVSIPLAGGADSLNVAVAAGILLHEVRNA